MTSCNRISESGGRGLKKRPGTLIEKKPTQTKNIQTGFRWNINKGYTFRNDISIVLENEMVRRDLHTKRDFSIYITLEIGISIIFRVFYEI